MSSERSKDSDESRDALAESENRLQESITVRGEANWEFARLRESLQRNHFADNVRAILTGGHSGA
jgi:hypothetical protein